MCVYMYIYICSCTLRRIRHTCFFVYYPQDAKSVFDSIFNNPEWQIGPSSGSSGEMSDTSGNPVSSGCWLLCWSLWKIGFRADICRIPINNRVWWCPIYAWIYMVWWWYIYIYVCMYVYVYMYIFIHIRI